MFGPKLILSAEGVKAHSKPPYNMNGAFVHLLKFCIKMNVPFSGSKTDFVLLMA